jgi:hypothetical protein
MALTISGTSNGKLGNLSLSNRTANILDSGDTTFFSADTWRCTTNLDGPSGVLTNLERTDESSSGIVGTGMTQSSGVFTFPSTGIYMVFATCHFIHFNGDGLAQVAIEVTTDNSSFDLSSAIRSGHVGTTDVYRTHSGFAMVDVTDTSLVKVRFNCSLFGSETRLAGNTDGSYTHFYFIRLGDT